LLYYILNKNKTKTEQASKACVPLPPFFILLLLLLLLLNKKIKRKRRLGQQQNTSSPPSVSVYFLSLFSFNYHRTPFYPVKGFVQLIQCTNLAYKLRTKESERGERKKKIKEAETETLLPQYLRINTISIHITTIVFLLHQ
jgi:hypothetical protein